MKTLAIDIETYSSVSLQKSGVYAYAQSDDFDILLFGYAWDDGPVEVIDLARGQSIPQELQNALYDPEVLKTAFNASFERTCLSAYLGRITPPEQWSCTAVMARELGLPGSLEAVGEVIGLPEDKQKSKTGRALIRYFSIPCKPTKSNGQRTRNLPEHDPDRWAMYVEYNRQDVEAERAIRKKLSKFPIFEEEQPLWIHDQHINDRGVLLDRELAENAERFDREYKAQLLDEARKLTGLENVYMDQIGAFGAVDRDPGERVISLAYYALININEYDRELVHEHNAFWININDLPNLIFDHNEMVEKARVIMKQKASRAPIGFNLLPELFTLTQLQSLYEAIYGEPMDKRNFRKRIAEMGFIEKTDKIDKTGSRRGASLYKFNDKAYQKDPKFKL